MESWIGHSVRFLQIVFLMSGIYWSHLKRKMKVGSVTGCDFYRLFFLWVWIYWSHMEIKTLLKITLLYFLISSHKEARPEYRALSKTVSKYFPPQVSDTIYKKKKKLDLSCYLIGLFIYRWEDKGDSLSSWICSSSKIIFIRSRMTCFSVAKWEAYAVLSSAGILSSLNMK